MEILTVNAGSTSLKLEWYRLFDVLPALDDPPVPTRAESVSRADAAATLAALAPKVDAIAHRFVRVPDDAPAILALDPATIARLTALEAEAPLHNAAALEAVQELTRYGTPQFAVSDSAFHHTLSAAAATYALPKAITAQGVHRRGYHGLSHEYAAHRAARLCGRDVMAARIITLHLGGGSSLCAIENGRSIDTTMGYTPLEGVPMATRSGSVDPGILIHLLRGGMTLDALERMLETESGLLGISGTSGDVRTLSAACGDPDARRALDVFVWRIRAALGALIATLGGVDVIAFTGGIGEHAADLRAAIFRGAVPWGATLEAASNAHASGDTVISHPDAAVGAAVIRAREGWQLARAVR